jgi:hypothetical protein
MNPLNDIGNEETDLMILNLEESNNDINILETKEKIIISLSLFALRYSLSAIFWDRNVRAYEYLLDTYTNKPERQVRNYFY